MQTVLPYIVAVVVAIITGYISYATATKKSKTDLEALRISNQAEIEKLMSQHKFDLEALERKHEMDIEKMSIEHKHKLELVQSEMENNLGSGLINAMLGEVMKTPEVKNMMRQEMKKGSKSK